MFKRSICVLLSACMLFSAPLYIHAEGEEQGETTQPPVTTTPPTETTTPPTETTTLPTETTTPPTETTTPPTVTTTPPTETTTPPTETTAPPTETTTPPTETTVPPTEVTVPDEFVENKTRMSDEAIALLKQYEGFSKYPMWDVSQWSVGYGTRCPGDKLEYWKVVGITQWEAESLLNAFINNFGAKLDAFIEKHDLKLKQCQYDALMLFTYNVGTGWMNQTGLLQTAIISGATGNDFIYPFVLWCKADRVFSNGLIERRLAEANLYLNGKYSRKPPKDYRFVRFDTNGGRSDYAVQGFDEDEPVSIKVIAETTYTASNGAIYEFEGWYDKRVGGNKVEILDKNIENATYLYAHWKLIKEGTGSSDGNNSGGMATMVDVVVTANNLNYRSGPGTNYDAIGSYPKGRQLTIVETKSASGYLWGRVANVGNSECWVALEFTDYYEVIQNQQPTTQPTVPPTTVPPTTVPPTTVPPTTVPPTTVPPTTIPPTTTQPTTPPTTKPTEPESIFGTWEGVVKLNVSGSKLYIRADASTNAAQVGYLVHGEKITVVERKKVNDVEWGRTEKGWVCLNYVSFDPVDLTPPTTQPTEPPTTQTVPTEPATTVPPTTQTVPTEPPTTQPAPTEPAPTQPITTPPTTQPTEPPQTEETEPLYPNGDGYWLGTVNTAFLPVRNAAGTAHTIVDYYRQNDRVEITRCIMVEGQLWGRVDGGWICLMFVTLEGEESLLTDGFMTVNTCSLRVRNGAGLDNTIVTFLSFGDVIAIRDRQYVGSTLWGLTDWGWVDLQYLR